MSNGLENAGYFSYKWPILKRIEIIELFFLQNALQLYFCKIIYILREQITEN